MFADQEQGKRPPLDQEFSHRVADVIDAAADRLDKIGWIQGQFGGEERGECALGALWSVANCECPSTHSSSNMDCPFTYGRRAITEVKDFLSVPTLDVGINVDTSIVPSSIALWNDAPGRTQGDVTNALRKAALGLRERA